MISTVLPIYSRTEFAIERGEGVYLFDTEGKKYLDFAAGIAVNSLGHCHPHLVAALQKQAATLWHTSNMYRLPGQESFADRLVKHTFADTVFFCNSGAEATECAIKMVRKYHDETENPDKFHIICIEGSFHGRTLTTISASGKEKIMKGFEPAVEGFRQVPFNDLDAMKAAITDKTAAIMFETIMGEGGIKVSSPEYLRAVRKLCDERGLLLVLDEVQCGVGRTGQFFAFEAAGITPDIVAVAKGIGSGFPLGVCLATEKVGKTMTAGSHGTTYGGNPLAMAVGNAVLDIVLADGFMAHVTEMGTLLKSELEKLVKKYPAVLKEVRGVGLILGLVTVVDNMEMVKRMRAAGLLSVGGGENVIRILPPLIIEKAHINEAIALLETVCKGYAT
ncbi:MAG: aspartate aminotransferase family protein [Alphaproteobacteria bacterium]|nr:aspartate aminotransferase family protein [Alphaproteobacteria bacterium]